jgi:hypothetical protein
MELYIVVPAPLDIEVDTLIINMPPGVETGRETRNMMFDEWWEGYSSASLRNYL